MTRIPSCAKFAARQIAEVDLPSEGRELVTRRVFGAPEAVENCRAVLNDRYASAPGEVGSSRIFAKALISPESGTTGITPSTATPKSSSTSSGDLYVSSSTSRTKIAPAHASRASAKAKIKLFFRLGLTGPPGT